MRIYSAMWNAVKWRSSFSLLFVCEYYIVSIFIMIDIHFLFCLYVTIWLFWHFQLFLNVFVFRLCPPFVPIVSAMPTFLRFLFLFVFLLWHFSAMPTRLSPLFFAMFSATPTFFSISFSAMLFFGYAHYCFLILFFVLSAPVCQSLKCDWRWGMVFLCFHGICAYFRQRL